MIRNKLKEAFESKKLYELLDNNRKNGENYSSKDLTYEILYQLTVIENTPDSLIGNIFNMTKSQVRNRRIKNDIENIFLKRVMMHPELYYGKLIRSGYNVGEMTDEEILRLLYEDCRNLAIEKRWKIETLDKYYNEKLQTHKTKTIIEKFNLDEITFCVKECNMKHVTSKEKSKKNTKGKKINQVKSNQAKIDAGKLGEKIAKDFEQDRLKKLGLAQYIEDVEIITKTPNKEITLDGDGYDIVSRNELGETIYIEVKCSTTNKSKNINFNITLKEVALMNGLLDNIDARHAFIYYVFNIDIKNYTAEVLRIDNEMFKKYKLNPIVYEVNEIYE